LRDNERSILWEFVPSPPAKAHHHQRDAVAFAFAGKSPKATFVPRGTVHNDEAAAGADRVYVVDLK
jgi:hypothetical protein